MPKKKIARRTTEGNGVSAFVSAIRVETSPRGAPFSADVSICTDLEAAPTLQAMHARVAAVKKRAAEVLERLGPTPQQIAAWKELPAPKRARFDETTMRAVNVEEYARRAQKELPAERPNVQGHDADGIAKRIELMYRIINLDHVPRLAVAREDVVEIIDHQARGIEKLRSLNRGPSDQAILDELESGYILSIQVALSMLTGEDLAGLRVSTLQNAIDARLNKGGRGKRAVLSWPDAIRAVLREMNVPIVGDDAIRKAKSRARKRV